MHAVLDTKPGSIYNDKTSSLYHFPSRYKKILDECVGDWVIFREPRDEGGRMSYIAYGRIDRITKDAEKSNHYYAHITDFEDFDELVPWRLEGAYWEKALRDIETPKVGIYMRGRSVRELNDKDFAGIMQYGSPFFSRSSLKAASLDDPGFTEPASESYEPESDEILEREVVAILSNKKMRDSRFRHRIMNAYSNRCAFTGLSITDRDGKQGLQAAHILSVGKNGPDTISNGLALTHTVHWMFDNFLLSIDDDYKLLISTKGSIPKQYRDLLLPATSGIYLPENKKMLPGLNFIRLHREAFWAIN